ncbi:MAG: hypothetical protein HY429_01570 [Candidatus Levybacteria bacterium]|nr:hypothetical protein [Candidatus Levybacteria bacterium]
MNEQEKEFWEKFKRWNLDDIERTIKTEAYVGAAKLICCVIDALAGFRFGAVSNQGSKFRFISFVKEFMPKFKYRLLAKRNGIVIYKRSILEMLYNNFRSGLIHEGLPGIGTGIFRDENIHSLFRIPKPDKLEINVLGLFEYLKFALSEYEGKLNKGIFLNEFRERLNFIGDKRRIPKIS